MKHCVPSALLRRLALAAPLALISLPTMAATTGTQVTDVPVCSKPLGALAVVEPETNWWTERALGSPAALIKVFVNKSRCFTLVDRSKGMAAAMAERELAAGGDLRGGSNVGKGQVRAADYVLVPDLVSQNQNAGGNAIGGLVGGLIGNRTLGAAVGGISLKKKTADVVLTITDVRSSEQVASVEGHSTKTDLGWGGGGAVFAGGFGGAGASGYDNTEIGKVITLAYLQAYSDLVKQLGGLSGDAPAANSQQAVTMSKPGRLFANADGTGAVVRPLDVGMMLYPTGNKQGAMWEVNDELGNKGWVSSLLFNLAK